METRYMSYKDLQFSWDLLSLQVLPDGENKALPIKESQILRILLEAPQKTFSRDELCSRIWGNTRVSPRALDTHICRLRRSLVGSSVQIEGIYGKGYTLV